MKRLFFLALTCLVSELSFSQSAAQVQSEADVMNDPKVIELKKRHDQIAEQSGRPKSTSFYMGYDDILRSYFIGNSIPAELPKANDSFTKKQYVALLNDWISKNPQYLRPEHKNSLITE